MSPKQSKSIPKKSAKRPRPTPTEQYQQECTSQYSKLHHTSSKLLHREGKIVKSFECQKIVRGIKDANETLDQLQQKSDGGKEVEKAKKKVSTLESKLERTKKLELDVLVSVGLKRLGIVSLDPKLNSIDEDETTEFKTLDDANDQSQDPFYTTLIETMLRHKRLSTAMDQINDKVSDYQSWATHREEVLLTDNSEQLRGKKKKKKQTHQQNRENETLVVAGSTKRHKIDLGGHEGTSGLFIGSLSGQKVEGYSDDEAEGYEGYEDEGLYEKKKKNRPGQRARKAKAMAIEAKKAGRTWDSSINWREKKEDTEHDDSRGGRKHHDRDTNKRRGKGEKAVAESTKPAKAKSQDIATMGKSWKEEGKAHPSWAAAAAQKSQGIVEFKGTKITF